MQIKGIRITIVLAVIIILLAMLYGGNYIYQKINVEQPLFKLYQDIKSVEDIKINDQNEITVLTVKLKGTDNLRKTYTDIYNKSKEVLGDTPFEIKIKDNRNPVLEQVYYNSQFIIYEALMNGNFSQMAETIRAEGTKAGANTKVYIDDKNIYLQISKDKNYLYEVVPRPGTAIPVLVKSGEEVAAQ